MSTSKPKYDRFSQLVIRSEPSPSNLVEFYCPRDGSMVEVDDAREVGATISFKKRKARIFSFPCGECGVRYIRFIEPVSASPHFSRDAMRSGSLNCTVCVDVDSGMQNFMNHHPRSHVEMGGIEKAIEGHGNRHAESFDLNGWLNDGRFAHLSASPATPRVGKFLIGQLVRSKNFRNPGILGTVVTPESQDGFVQVRIRGSHYRFDRDDRVQVDELVKHEEVGIGACWIANVAQRMLEASDEFEMLAHPDQGTQKAYRMFANALRESAAAMTVSYLGCEIGKGEFVGILDGDSDLVVFGNQDLEAIVRLRAEVSSIHQVFGDYSFLFLASKVRVFRDCALAVDNLLRLVNNAINDYESAIETTTIRLMGLVNTRALIK